MSTGRQRCVANHVVMVPPTSFGFNEETAGTNEFMHANLSTSNSISNAPGTRTASPDHAATSAKIVQQQASIEWHNVKSKLEAFGVKVSVLMGEQHDKPDFLPDAVFPNNWFSTFVSSPRGGGGGDHLHQHDKTSTINCDGTSAREDHPLMSKKIAIYPMLCPSRQREVKIESLVQLIGWNNDYAEQVRESESQQQLQQDKSTTEIVDLRGDVEEGAKTAGSTSRSSKVFLEGTGCLVFDHWTRTCFLALSPRANSVALAESLVCDRMGYDLVVFETVNNIYHTNVIMTVGKSVAVVCLEQVKGVAAGDYDEKIARAVEQQQQQNGDETTDEKQKIKASTRHRKTTKTTCFISSKQELQELLEQKLLKKVIDISFAQVENFAGNCLELAARSNKSASTSTTATTHFGAGDVDEKENMNKQDEELEFLWLLSTTAEKAFTEEQKRTLSESGYMLVCCDVSTIEKIGGGGVRCMVAEVFW
ncbi:unnamed protein product [Amoebophrya sp. A120]|nr:unnamed protein product [Amoebophrya sp. A120]|eukprot:GSA120T00014461001.1